MLHRFFFQQDGKPPHTAKSVQTRTAFGKKFLDNKMRPPRSPYLNPCDFFLWGYLKGKVYNPLPKTLDDLKVNIVRSKRLTIKTFYLVFIKKYYL
jgi:hypothetical protein